MNSFLLCVALFPVIGIAAYAAYRLFPAFFTPEPKSFIVPKGTIQPRKEEIFPGDDSPLSIEISNMWVDTTTMRDDFDTSNPVNGWYVSTNPMYREEIHFDRWDNK